MLKNFLSFIFFIILFLSTAYSETKAPVSWSGNKYVIIKKHNDLFKKFSKSTCKPGDERKYIKLLKAYRGEGFYLPKINDDIDRDAIKKNLYHFKKKSKFIAKMIDRLKKDKEFPNFALIHKDIDELVDELLLLKKQSYQALRPNKKKKILKESRLKLIVLKKQFDIFLNNIYFMKSYNFPNDFLSLRERYEEEKYKTSTRAKKLSNQIFFFRKIVEDGALNPDRTRPDKYIRTALDTLYLSIQKEKDFISENVRYDLEWIERRLEKIIEKGKTYQLKRLEEWKGRTDENHDFYSELIKIKNKNKARFLVKKQNEASHKLQEFVYNKEAETYEFWSKQSELSKALYTLETIIVNEVGVIDGKFGLERRSVAEVVINRYYDDFYNQLESDQILVEHISKDIEIKKQLWLNVLFKVGEFSFTYHYIPAVSQIFCPDMSRRGRAIRKKNLKIALDALKEYDGSFKAFRYFSRISMLGKIDMSSVWTDYQRLPEMVGYKSIHQAKLARYYHSDKYKYLYQFVDKDNIQYTVVKIKDKTYSMRWAKGRPVFYDYRNPHLFAYFSKKN